jgi:hypothetical protein
LPKNDLGLPKVQSQYFPFLGGVDQMTPAIAIPDGALLDCQNYEPEISGGYRRIDGFERYDGHASPTSAVYYTLTINLTGAISVGNTITGQASGATGKVLAVFGSTYVLGRVTGTFASGENVTVSAAVQGVLTGIAYAFGAGSPSDDADYALLAANDLRGDISVVPGSGPIRGVWVYNDVVYAFRDNVGATACLMYKATTSGWVQVQYGTELQYTSSTGGGTAIQVGQTIGNAASPTKTATVLAVVNRTGTWGSGATGTLIITPVTGSFSNADPIFVGATQLATASAAATTMTRPAGGTYEFVNASFSGSTNAVKMYGADGVGLAFEFDGTTYVPIRTGMATDTPAHIIFHKFYLFLAFRGSIQISSLGSPYAWTVILGAAEIAVPEIVTGFTPQGGNAAGSSLAIFTSNRVYILYGSSTSDFKLVNSIYDIGYFSGTMQPVSNTTFGLTARGIQSLITTLTYGDFDFASVSHKVTRFLVSKRGLQTCSTSSRAKDQYRVYFSDGMALCMGLTADQPNGFTMLNYGKPVRCICTAQTAAAQEVTYFGSDDGYVYQDNIGTSFDGAAIESWIRPAFNHSKSPRVRKRYRRAVFEVFATGYSQVSVGYDIGYGTGDVLQPELITSNQVFTGGYWDQFTWDQFTWDAKVVSDVSIALTGTEKNISFIFYSNRAQDKSHTVQGVTIFHSPQRTER